LPNTCGGCRGKTGLRNSGIVGLSAGTSWSFLNGLLDGFDGSAASARSAASLIDHDLAIVVIVSITQGITGKSTDSGNSGDTTNLAKTTLAFTATAVLATSAFRTTSRSIGVF